MSLRILGVAVLVAASLACGSQARLRAAPEGSVCPGPAGEEGPLVVEVESGGRTRRALIWLPQTPGPHDVVINLHEFRSEPKRQAYYSGWFPFFREADVILVAPDGKSSTWNVGTCCGRAHEQGVDDVAFLDALVAKVEAATCSSGRVMVTGIGNGGMMAEHWACHSDVPDAVVSVGGSLQVDECPQSRPIPILHYHGGQDRFVPIGGGEGILAGEHKPVAHAEKLWRARNGTAPSTQIIRGPLTCKEGVGSAASTRFCTLARAGDTWPGAEDAPQQDAVPLTNATTGAWAWVTGQWSKASP